ncbi:protein of unknown function [Modestobacter italicus]|uniref:Uncharacterized protein n=1 Tax=Modestobacter italicus (strain DSM 44449 / CECT 9708 / BC 501) TaxID=2732864 RepID=I4ERS7_MODI5|nr:protein of unknown function [Modestobacter marinus]
MCSVTGPRRRGGPAGGSVARGGAAGAVDRAGAERRGAGGRGAVAERSRRLRRASSSLPCRTATSTSRPRTLRHALLATHRTVGDGRCGVAPGDTPPGPARSRAALGRGASHV